MYISEFCSCMFFFSSRRRHTRCALVTGVQTCALPISAVGRYVMRKKPAGELLASAHRIDREYRIMAALHGVIPVPRMLHLCLDEPVLGQAFYLMDHVAGRIDAVARLIDHIGRAPSVERLCQNVWSSVAADV